MTDEIRIPALKTGDGAVVHPEYWLGKPKQFNNTGFRMVYENVNNWPTSGELVHAYFGKDATGVYVCPEFRDSVYAGSFLIKDITSTFLLNGHTLVIGPHTVEKYGGYETAVGGTGADFLLGRDGWITEFDALTGFPSRLGKEGESMEAFGEPVKFTCYGDGQIMSVCHEGTLKVATLRYANDRIELNVRDRLPSVGDANERTCRRAQFDQASYEAFRQSQNMFAAEIKSMDLDGLKARMRTDPDFARRFDEYITAERRLRSELS